ncbi:MAG: hypothetical protein CL507_01450 [Actinobacteria bacterium]|jgi:hypothetical protein|nr:hypothetical protein [Actinomycetota bacterium]|tara:strand:- start:297 stop:698 length:402 start_codon:yes stop_codon:yes gene_type:complete
MWYYNNELFELTPEEYQGFVYQITELHTNKKYIGKKNFWKPKILPINKTRKRRVRTRVESDWKTYFSSSSQIQKLVEESGEEKFKREILKLCKTKGEMSYYEAKLQFENNVLFRDDYYNEFIGCRVHSKHLTC